MIRPQLCRQCGLVRPAGDGGDAVAQLARVLQAEMAKATDPLDRHQRSRPAVYLL
jgi:hypothetical protein